MNKTLQLIALTAVIGLGALPAPAEAAVATDPVPSRYCRLIDIALGDAAIYFGCRRPGDRPDLASDRRDLNASSGDSTAVADGSDAARPAVRRPIRPWEPARRPPCLGCGGLPSTRDRR